MEPRFPYGERHRSVERPIGRRESEALAVLIASSGGSDYGRALDDLARCAAPFDMSCAFAFSDHSPPVVIHDGYSKTVDRGALRSYLRGAYLLDPFYSASIAASAEGVWRMRDLAPDDFYESHFAWSREVHPCISDQAGTLVEEVGFVIPLADHVAVTYSLMRNRGGSPFDAAEFVALAALTPIVGASLRQHWRSIHAASSAAPGRRFDAETVFHQAFGEMLTPAQRAVTKLILRGHSTVSIAGHLGITEGTVKIHRSNIYRRLGISSQNELFQRFIDYLAD